MRKLLVLVVPFTLAVALAGCKKVDSGTVRLAVRGHEIFAEVAADREKRAQGLMFRTELGEDRGMLFIYPDERILSFWMKNTTVPLSIAYLDAQGTINEIHYLRPLDLQSVPSVRPARFALEMNAGWFESRGIRPGDRIEIPEAVRSIRGDS